MLIKFHSYKTAEPVYINPYHVVIVTKGDNCTEVRMTGDITLSIKQDFGTVISKINEELDGEDRLHYM